MQTILNYLQRYQQVLSQLENELTQCPAGHLFIKGNQYYHKIGSEFINITDETEKIQHLARKNILPYLIKQRQSNLKILIHNMKNPKNPKPLDRTLPQHFIKLMASSYQQLTNDYFWHPKAHSFQNEVIHTEFFKPDQLNYTANDGKKYRSKAERDSANSYLSMGIPYRYEKPFFYKNKKYLPDFTLINPWTGEIMMHEHFGGFHIEGYAKGKIEKVRYYRKAGFKNMVNIIYTYEEDLENLDAFKNTVCQVLLQI